ncbi:MAG: hypothetical protein O2931_00275 [Planctomycetota bacterium]|nr:hypothetical protein [Planctomycetota bacterium]MDA1177209.1 hypothetical protein [Planctomycetota bacterium]
MRRVVFIVLMAAVLNSREAPAQCRGGRQGASSAVASTRFLQGPFSSSAASPLANIALLNRYQSQIAQQQYIIAMQQQALQQAYFARVNQQRQDQQVSADPLMSESLSEVASNREGDLQPARANRGSRQGFRRQKAERFFEMAERAQKSGDPQTAEVNLRKVAKIMPETDSLGQEARVRLADLAVVR